MFPMLVEESAVAAVLALGAGLVRGLVVAVVALTSVVARTPARRRDARATLTILLRREPRDSFPPGRARIEGSED
ncbi:hypothetical protein [Kitasatospora sp. NPDC088134]|uniref:hypothetical protein n=1 Tax=Kitasatospora sp. NPDC088134 TaxID=3364071 RepID=UPI003830AD14